MLLDLAIQNEEIIEAKNPKRRGTVNGDEFFLSQRTQGEKGRISSAAPVNVSRETFVPYFTIT